MAIVTDRITSPGLLTIETPERVRSTKSRTTVSWTEAQFEAYCEAGATVDFASTAYHVQDASDAPQVGFNGTTGQLGFFDVNGDALFTFSAVGGLTDAVDDAAAASAGVPVNSIYRTGSTLKIRVA